MAADYEAGFDGTYAIALFATLVLGTFFAMGINATAGNEEDDDFLK